MVDAVIPRDVFSTTHTSASDVSVTQAGMVTGASTKVRDLSVIIPCDNEIRLNRPQMYRHSLLSLGAIQLPPNGQGCHSGCRQVI